MMERTWKVKPVDERQISRLAVEMDLSPLLARLLIHRGADSSKQAQRFLCPDLDGLPDPSGMADLPKGAARIRKAAGGGEPILVVGDYDVDGLTGAALLIRVLRSLGAEVSWRIPHRTTDGYGLKPKMVEEAGRDGVALLITVDCGTTHVEELMLARRLGIDTIVVDHHDLLPTGRPPCLAFLNPLEPGCEYPTKDLASVGVAFTLVRGLLKTVSDTVFQHLDLVALGTVADMAPLVGENRVLVKAGLHVLAATGKAGLRALMSRVGTGNRPLTPEEISFRLAPPLNAMGRTGSAECPLRLLLTDDPAEAFALVRRIERENRTRGELERQAFRKARAKVEREVNFAKDWVIVLEDTQWHPGVAGIIATRIASRYHRPTVVIARNGPVCRGSARSIRGFHLVEALEQVKEHLLEFGGHPAAAGLTIEREKIPPFREALNRAARDRIDPNGLKPMLELDGELPLASLTEELMRDLEMLAPFGMGNPAPLFFSEDARLPEEPRRGKFDLRGIRWQVQDSEGRTFDLLQPRQDLWEGQDLRRLAPGPIRIAYSPGRCGGEGGGPMELRLHDIKRPKTTGPV